MANQRIYIKCVCGRTVFLVRRLGEGFYVPEGLEQSTVPRLDEFFDEHEWCGGTLDHYELDYEHDRE